MDDASKAPRWPDEEGLRDASRLRRLIVRFPARTREGLLAAYHPDVLCDGALLRTRNRDVPVQRGHVVALRFELASGAPVLSGEAEVVEIVRRGETSLIKLRFGRLDQSGLALHLMALAERESSKIASCRWR